LIDDFRLLNETTKEKLQVLFVLLLTVLFSY